MIRNLRWQTGNGGTHFAFSDGDIVAEVSFPKGTMVILGLRLTIMPPPNVDSMKWSQQEVTKFLNANHPWAIWRFVE